MPRVPTYDSFQVAPSATPGVRLNAPEVQDTAGPQAQAMGQGLSRAGNAMTSIAVDMQNEANQVRVNDAMNQFVKLRTDAQVQAMSLRGRNALERPDGKSLPDEFGEKLDNAAQELAGTLGNDVQRRVFQQQAATLSNQFRGTLSLHMVEQQKVFRAETQNSAIQVAQNQGALLYADPAIRKQSTDAIVATVKQMGDDAGWDAPTREAKLSEAMSPMHAGIMKAMIQGGNAGEARKYYDEHSAEMTMQTRAAFQPVIKEASDAQTAQTSADAVWSKLGPKMLNEPVKIFDMEAQLRKDLESNPDAMAKGIAALRERSAAFNAQQAEVKAQGIAGVWKLVDSGTSMAQVQRSDAWLSLSDTERHQIRKDMESEAATRAARAESNSRRQLQELQVNERLNFLRNGDAYLTASDPDVLSKMSRAQVEAKRGMFGMEATQQLLSKWEQLQKPGKIAEARFDTEDFNQVADDLGLKPYEAKKSDDERKALGTLKYRVEQLLDMRQQREGRTLSRQEKQEVMRDEMAKTVLVDPGFFSPNRDVPVVQLTSEQLGRVVVPDAERKQIVSALQTMNQRNPNNPAFFPTEENVKRLYVRKVSPAGGLIRNAK